MEDKWSSLKSDEKYEIIRDYVRRGFNNLDDIMDDYNRNNVGVGQVLLNKPVSRSAIEDVLNEWYGGTTFPDAPDQYYDY